MIPKEEGEEIKRGPVVRMPESSGPIDDVFEADYMVEFIQGSGHYVILPRGTELLDNIQALLEKWIRQPLDYDRVCLPKMAPVETFRKANILGKWDSYLLSAKPFGDTEGVEEEYLLDPLQCTTFYQFHEDKKVNMSKGPRKWHDNSGPTFRNEDLDKHELGIKQREYHRSEFIYLGTREQVIETREETLTRLERLCEELGLQYRIVVGGGCYELKDGEMHEPESEEEIPIKDLEVYLPHQDRWLEVAGSSVLGNTMARRFNIEGTNGEELWSGCTGIGLERMMYAIVAYQR